MTLTAIAPSANVVKHKIIEKMKEARKPNCVAKVRVIPIKETISKTR